MLLILISSVSITISVFFSMLDAQAFHFSHFGGGNVSIAVDSLNCNGNESSWTKCSYDTTFIFLCDHTEDSGLRCFNG